MTVDEFHAARRIFAVKDETVLVGPENHPYTHTEWLMSLLGPDMGREWIAANLRGYVYNGRIVVYVGEFSHRVDHQQVLAAIAVMSKLYPLTEVGFGAVPGPNQPWEPKTVLPLNEYLEKVKRGR